MREERRGELQCQTASVVACRQCRTVSTAKSVTLSSAVYCSALECQYIIIIIIIIIIDKIEKTIDIQKFHHRDLCFRDDTRIRVGFAIRSMTFQLTFKLLQQAGHVCRVNA